MDAISLFSGCLGLDLGLEAAGWNILWACEKDDACRRVIERQRPGLEVLSDVHEVDAGAPRAELLAGGFPCQDLSHAGAGAGLTGDRSALWFAMADAIRLLRPRLVLIENVPGLATKMGARAGESALGSVIADLAEAGYVGSAIRLRAADVGAPHIRERIFLLATDTGCSSWSRTEGRGRSGALQGPEESGRETLEPGRRDQGDRDEGSLASADASGLRRREVSGGALGDEGSASGRATLADHESRGAGSSGLQAATAADAERERHDGRRGRDEAGAPSRGRDRRGEPQGHQASAPDTDDAGRSEHGGAVAARAELGAAERGGVQDVADAGRESGQPRRGRRASRGTDSRRGSTERDRDGLMGSTEPGKGEAAPDADGVGRGLGGESEWRELEGSLGDITDRRDGEIEWGIYEPAIRSWERILRPAPRPTDDRGRLSPEFVEWMMGFPADWTAGESRTARLRMLGNAVQVQVATIVGGIMAASSRETS